MRYALKILGADRMHPHTGRRPISCPARASPRGEQPGARGLTLTEISYTFDEISNEIQKSLVKSGNELRNLPEILKSLLQSRNLG